MANNLIFYRMLRAGCRANGSARKGMSCGYTGTVATGLAFFAFAATLAGKLALGAAVEDVRFVPQLQLTDLRPIKVAFAPDDGSLLVVVNSYGRIDLFDISNPGRPAKITEIAAAARDAAFSPQGTPREKIRIVSGGDVDGTVRLWTL